MKLLLVSNFYDIPNEHFALNLIFCEGLDTFHLRKKDYTEDQMREYLERIPDFFHERIILHSHFHLVEEYGLKGAHFTKKYTFPEYVHGKRDSKAKRFARMGFSYHTINEVVKEGSIYDYVFLSPIFDSISNKGYNSKFNPGELKKFLQQTVDRPEVIALGGINEKKVEMAQQLGFDGIALLGHIWTDFEMDQDIKALANKFLLVQKSVGKFHSHGSNMVTKVAV
ncbi:MAG: thiamine phosphate synthase [Bacteroidota bacterium]